MKKTILSIAIGSLIIIGLTGCGGSNNVKLNVPEYKITNDKTKSYVRFTNTVPLDSTIYEFNKETNELTKIVTLNNSEKFIQVKEPKVSYYIISNIAVDRMIEVDLRAGEIVDINARLGQVIPKSRNELIQNIKGLECNEKKLKRYGFEKGFTDSWSSDILSLEVVCEKGLVSKVIDDRSFNSEIVENSTLIKPNDDYTKNEDMPDSIKEKVQNLYHFYIKLHKKALQNYQYKRDWSLYSIEVIKATEDNYANKFDSISFIENSNGNKELDLLIKEYLSKYNSSNRRKVGISYDIINIVDGSRLKRYFQIYITGANSDKNASTMQLEVKFIDLESNKVIGKIVYNSLITGGIFGGGGLLDDTAKYIIEYGKLNFLK